MSQIANRRFSRNRTLFGLRTNAAIRIRYNVESEKVVEVIGLDAHPEEIEISELKGFNLPQFISVSGIPYFPGKYEFSEGDVWYHARKPPAYQIKLVGIDSILGERAKVMRARITPEMLEEFDKSSKVRPRRPSQSQVMRESAATHAQRLIDNGVLVVPSDSIVQWHWCHLVAFTMLPSHRAQVARNLVVGSAACNGHMSNIEAAVKLFIYETKRPVSLEVTATIIADTHLGRRIRFQMWEQKSQMLFTDYFDALTEIRSDYADFENIYVKLMNEFESKITSCSK